MADDNNARYRSNDPFGRGPASAAPANDPLAELARLIGQNDPFAEYGRDARAPAQPAPRTSARYDSDPAPSYLGTQQPAPQYASEPAPQHYSPSRRRALPTSRAPHYSIRRRSNTSRARPAVRQPSRRRSTTAADPRASIAARLRRPHNGWPGFAAGSAVSGQRSLRAAATALCAAAPPARAFTPSQGYASPNYAGQPYADPRGRPGTESYQPDRAGFDAAGFPAPPERPGYAPPLYPHEPEAGGDAAAA